MQFISYFTDHPALQLVILIVSFDIVTGSLRACKERCFNSSVGIDGAIRKASMLASVLFFGLIDQIVSINVISFIPADFMEFLPVKQLGSMEFFSVLYAAYEGLSVLKNMRLMGLPMPKRLENALDKLLSEMTNEIKTGEAE